MHWPYRDYSTYLGRWLQVEKLGMIPNDDLSINPFAVLKQYKDGMNLYDYVKSNPVVNIDPTGLTLVPIRTASAKCCKIRRWHTVWYPTTGPIDRASCTQNTIYSDCSAAMACCAAYKYNRNTTVYESAEGECCWCNIYIKSDLANIFVFEVAAHRRVIVECEQG